MLIDMREFAALGERREVGGDDIDLRHTALPSPGRDQELRDVEARVREDTETRDVYVERPMRVEYPQVRLFGSE